MTDTIPKFKVGDLVDFIGKDQDSVKCNPWTITSIEAGKIGATYYNAHSKSQNVVGSFWEDFITLHTQENKMTTTTPKASNKFYLVYSRDGIVESEFNTLQAAENEARNMAEQHIGEEFFVMESIAVASVRTTFEKL